MKKETLDERLAKLNEELDRMLGISKITSEKTLLEQLTDFGLTINEAKAWLEQEPNFMPSDEILHDNRSDEDFTEPLSNIRCGVI